MKGILAAPICALMIGSLCAAPVPSHAATGNVIFALCEKGDRIPADRIACYAYIRAVLDDASFIDPFLDPAVGGDLLRVCLRPSVTDDQVYDVVMRDWRSFPETRDANAAGLIRGALLRAFPCPKKP